MNYKLTVMSDYKYVLLLKLQNFLIKLNLFNYFRNYQFMKYFVDLMDFYYSDQSFNG